MREKFIEQSLENNKAVLGICLGAQLIADVLGAKVFPSRYREIGWFKIEKTASAANSSLVDWLPASIEAFHWHGDTFDLPTEAVHLARSEACENQGFIVEKHVIALQFHLEINSEGVQRLISQCSNEIEKSPFVQSGEKMIADEDRFCKINASMESLLNQLAGFLAESS